ncbi:MAG: HEAT repeat domain-containing protein [Chloroflexi bacterium]|nr:HEAT repeat domain-containing protein [Chloroflexota bacterium]
MAKVRRASEAKRRPATIDETLRALSAGEQGTLNAKVFYGLSDLSEADVEKLKTAWLELGTEYRRKLLLRLEDVSETNFDLDFRAFGLFALEDEDAEVRKSAIGVLWSDESLAYMRRLMELAQWDESTDVRAAAASELGRFILMAELGDLPEDDIIPAQDLVIALMTDESEELDVRRRALEAISNSSHEVVEEAIREAYEHSELLMRVSAVFAMGRSCDEQWGPLVLREMHSVEPEMRYEAARAAGELMLAEAVPHLAKVAQGNDREIKEVAIWSLGEIGGREALRVLTALAQDADVQDDKDLLEVVEDAIGMATLAGGDLPFFLDTDARREREN